MFCLHVFCCSSVYPDPRPAPSLLQALQQSSGVPRRQYEAWRAALLSCLSHVEAVIDFGEDEQLADDVAAEVLPRVVALQTELQRHLAAGAHEAHLVADLLCCGCCGLEFRRCRLSWREVRSVGTALCPISCMMGCASDVAMGELLRKLLGRLQGCQAAAVMRICLEFRWVQVRCQSATPCQAAITVCRVER